MAAPRLTICAHLSDRVAYMVSFPGGDRVDGRSRPGHFHRRLRHRPVALGPQFRDIPRSPPPASGRSPTLGKVTEPFQHLSLRAELREAQQRIDRAARQLELAAQLEARLETVLLGPSPEGFTLGPSPARHATELQATGILLEAELRAAEILNASADPEGGAPGPAVPSIGTDVARAIEHHLQALADVEKSLVELGTRALQLEEGDGAGAFDSPGTSQADGRGRPGGSVFPIPGPLPPRHEGEPF